MKSSAKIDSINNFNGVRRSDKD